MLKIEELKDSGIKKTVHSRYINAVYLILLCIIGVLIRVGAYGDIYVAVIQTIYFDGIFVTILSLLTIGYRATNPRVSAINTFLCVALSAALGVIYGVIIIPSTLFPIIHAIEPRTMIISYVRSSWVYYTLISTIWSLTVLWTMNIRASIENEIAAINARNDAEKRVMLSELRRLRQQLDPHFIFNSLNAIITEVYDDPRKAAALLRELSAYLRYTLAVRDQEFAPVAAEVGALRSFLRVQDMRFGEKLVSSVEVDPDARNRSIPTLLLQPLVENALKFGIADESGVLRIDVMITTQDTAMTIVVRNSGVLHQAARGGTGVGLQNLRSRLAMHYGDRGSFELRQADQSVVATIELEGEPE